MSLVSSPWRYVRRSPPVPARRPCDAVRSTRPAPSRMAAYCSGEYIGWACWYSLSMRLQVILRSPFYVLLFSMPAAAHPQQAAVPAEGSADFIVIQRGAQIGREQVQLSRTPQGWIITGTA